MRYLKAAMGILLGITMAVSLWGCEGTDIPNGVNQKEVHEPITVMTMFKNMSGFVDLVHEKYPEINLEVIPYSGENMSAYTSNQLKTNDMPDIYISTIYAPGQSDVSDRLIDLSGYAFTDNYLEARLHEVSDHGEIYMLPTSYTCIGITYNKTLLEKHGWKLPKSFRELEELAPKVKEAGCRLALVQTEYPGYGFQYICNILDTNFLNSMDGRKWQADFLEGKTTVAGNPQMMEAMRVLEKWRDIGMLDGEGNPDSDYKTRKIMAEGNTLFLLGSTNILEEKDTTDEFGLMPYLSEDGSQNVLVMNVSRYVGLNKKLEEKGNEQKLEDAVHVVELLSTVEGMSKINESKAQMELLPLKDFNVGEDNYYKDIEKELNAGLTAPFIYSGWDNLIVPVGETGIEYIKGNTTLKSVVDSFDDNQELLNETNRISYTTVTEKIENEDCARLIGIAFAKACDADLSLISLNKWYQLPDDSGLNYEGVSGCLFALPVTDQEITTILPTGWRGNIETVTLTGAQIEELIKKGYDRNGDGNTFPYKMIAPDSFMPEKNKTYKVVICGVTQEVAEQGNLTDTGILGLDVMREYFSRFPTFSKKDIKWE